MKFDVVVGNPPYNDSSAGRAPIYNKFIKQLVAKSPDYTAFIVPSNWFSQDHTKLGKEIRKDLTKLGLYKIEVNPITAFTNATVNTCTVYCRAGYQGNIDIFDLTTGNFITVPNIDKQIVMEFDPIGVSLLNKLKPEFPYTTVYGNKGQTHKWRIVTSYRKERFDIEPLNQLKVICPEYESQSGYRVFASFSSKHEAEINLEFYKSFWHSKLVRFIMIKTRNSTTLDNPQLRWVPVIGELTKIWTDDEIYKHFNLTTKEIDYIENLHLTNITVYYEQLKSNFLGIFNKYSNSNKVYQTYYNQILDDEILDELINIKKQHAYSVKMLNKDINSAFEWAYEQYKNNN